MDWLDRSQLPVISFEGEPEEIPFDTLRRALIERPCGLILAEAAGKLCGVISRGDILRAKTAGRKAVRPNRNFTSLPEGQLMRAREIFKEKENIHEIPVTDTDGRLTGVYTRGDDLLYLEYDTPWEHNRYMREFLQTETSVRFVRAPKSDIRRERIISRWVEAFEKSGVSCGMIGLEEIPRMQREGKRILIPDDETDKAVHLILEVLDDSAYDHNALYTYRKLENDSGDRAYDELIDQLTDAGVAVYNLYFTVNETTRGRRRLMEGFRKWMEQPEYAAQVGKLYVRMERNSIYSRLKDVEGPYFNVRGGERVTVGQPAEAQRTIWFFGPCFIIGGYVEDRYTIESILQQRLNKEGYSCRVVNCGCYETLYQRMIRITSTPMRPGDIVVLNMGNRCFEKTHNIDLMDILDKAHVPSGWLLNLPVHCNHKVNRLYADDLFRRMVKDGALKKAGAGSRPEML